ncbi:MAG: hypothetical protein IPK63_15540 [Candidatus Competibacteraceae bacterium]|nr:hypothetical protein [Candidatus Competibacteraceae bacterium]
MNERSGLYQACVKLANGYISGGVEETASKAYRSLCDRVEEWRKANPRKKLFRAQMRAGVSTYDVESDGKVITMVSVPMMAPFVESHTLDNLLIASHVTLAARMGDNYRP